MKQKQWHRGQIDSFLARGGDIKSVDRFLLRGGRIKTPQSMPAEDHSPNDFVFGAAYHNYVAGGSSRPKAGTPDYMLLWGLANGDLTAWDENH